MMHPVYRIYEQLMREYGPQGWWPLSSCEGEGGYHRGRYDCPRSEEEVFEVGLGAILTQNTTFSSVHKALASLGQQQALTPQGLLALSPETLKTLIRPCGYFNQKAEYLYRFTDFFIQLHGDVPSREALLSVKGIGEETADSILLYGYKKSEFVIDAYTERILSHLGLIEENARYGKVKALMQGALEAEVDAGERVTVYQEYHALFVAHAKRFYSKKPYGERDDILIA